jgi:hypothetical protein
VCIKAVAHLRRNTYDWNRDLSGCEVQHHIADT